MWQIEQRKISALHMADVAASSLSNCVVKKVQKSCLQVEYYVTTATTRLVVALFRANGWAES